MLAEELKKHAQKTRSTPSDDEPGPTYGHQHDPSNTTQQQLTGLPVTFTAMSLPAGEHFLRMAENLPPKPRVRPSPAPSLSLGELPILELPEPSLNNSTSLSSSIAGAGTSLALDDLDDEGTSGTKDEQGGTYVPPSPSSPPPHLPTNTHALTHPLARTTELTTPSPTIAVLSSRRPIGPCIIHTQLLHPVACSGAQMHASLG